MTFLAISTTTIIVSTVDVYKRQLQAEPKTTASSAPIRTARYPGPPERTHYPKKLEKGATIDLNSADTLLPVS